MTHLYEVKIQSDQGTIYWHTIADSLDEAFESFKGLATKFLCPESAVKRENIKKLKKVI